MRWPIGDIGPKSRWNSMIFHLRKPCVWREGGLWQIGGVLKVTIARKDRAPLSFHGIYLSSITFYEPLCVHMASLVKRRCEDLGHWCQLSLMERGIFPFISVNEACGPLYVIGRGWFLLYKDALWAVLVQNRPIYCNMNSLSSRLQKTTGWLRA